MTDAPQTPLVHGADAEYRRRLRLREFAIPECCACSRAIFYPRVVCHHCGSTDLRWIRPSGEGTVYSTTVVRGRAASHNVALVDLQEGVRMMSRVVDMPPEDVRIGMAVSARVDEVDGEALLVFVASGR